MASGVQIEKGAWKQIDAGVHFYTFNRRDWIYFLIFAPNKSAYHYDEG